MKTSKVMTNLEIAEVLRDIAATYELQDKEKNKFRIVAYQRAADAVEHATSELKDLWEEGKLTEVPGIGTSIAEHLDEIFKTGRSKHFDELTKKIPSVVFEFMKIPGIGVKTAIKLVNELKIKNLSDLKKAALKGEIAKLEGFGEDSQSAIIKSMEEFEKKPVTRHLLPYSWQLAHEVIEWIKKEKSVKRVDALGSLRRQAATVGDVDISVATNSAKDVIAHFAKYPKATRVLEKGEATCSIILPGNVQVDVMVQTPDSYGALLQHFTGSKHHNIALREYALKKGFSLSEYGIKKVRSGLTEVQQFKDEESFYKFLGLEYIAPELREDSGEIEAALEHKLPKLVDVKDVKGDLHIHSDFDIETSHDLGLSTMSEIIKKAKELNYEYIALTEHNPSKSKHNEREVVEILKRKREKVDQINSSRVIKVFNSLEIDILPDGDLPVSEEGLETLDFAVVSIHSSFGLNREKMTERVLRALDNPKVKIFAHPTARKLNEREGIDLNWEKVFQTILAKDIWLEINADPSRLDLPDTLVHEAVKRGVKMTLGTDSHHIDGMDNMRWGVSVARRGWAEKVDIINTLSLEKFKSILGLK